MPREIKTTIAVDGEAAFKRAINEANTSIRNMGTQLTLAAAQFKKDGDAMKLMETRSKALKGEIGQQNEIVKALEKAVTDSTKAYGENSEKTEKWEAELNRAKAKLISLQSELTLNEAGLDKNGRAFDENSQKAADYQATLETVGKGISFESINRGLGRITDSFEAAIQKVWNFGEKLWEVMAEAAKWADDESTLAKIYGVDVETLQRMQYAAELTDTSVESIVKSKKKLENNMVYGGKETQNLFEMLGIDIKDKKTGDYLDVDTVFWDLGETLRHVRAETQRDAWAMKLFGKSYDELNPLFAAGQKKYKEYMEEAQVVSAENTDKLTSLQDELDKLKNRWDTLKLSLLAEIADPFKNVASGLSGLLEQLNEWMKTEEGQKAIEGLSEALRDLFSGISDIKFTDAIETAKGAIEGIKSALVWLKNNRFGVENALKIIAGGFGLLKLSDGAIKVLQLVSGIRFLTGKGAASKAASAAEELGDSFGSALTSAIAKAAPWLIGIYEILKPGESKDTPIEETDYKGNTYDMTTHRYVADKTGNRVIIEEKAEDENGYITLQHLGQRKEIEESVDLDEVYSPEQIADAIQDWWDANQNAEKGLEDWDEVSKAQDWMAEVLGDSFDEVWLAIVKHLDETKNPSKLEDIPEEWYTEAMNRAAKQSDLNAQLRETLYNTGIAGPVNQKVLEYWRTGGNEDQIKGSDLKGFKDLPGQMQDKVQIGIERGFRGMRVYIDRDVIGRIVSEYIGEHAQ